MGTRQAAVVVADGCELLISGLHMGRSSAHRRAARLPWRRCDVTKAENSYVRMLVVTGFPSKG